MSEEELSRNVLVAADEARGKVVMFEQLHNELRTSDTLLRDRGGSVTAAD